MSSTMMDGVQNSREREKSKMASMVSQKDGDSSTHATPAVTNGHKRPKGLEGLRYQRVDGVNQFTFSYAGCLEELQQVVHEIKLRHDDVITVGFPRSGNHWTFEVVSMILSQCAEFQTAQFYSRLIEWLGKDVSESMDKLPSPRILTSHTRMHDLPRETVSKSVKTIYIVRNPKDTLVSMFKFCGCLKYEGCHFKGSWEDFFNLQMQGEFPWGSWFDHALATEKFRKDHPECPVFILVYEKMKENPQREIRRLCAFLDKPDAIAEKIAKQTEFTNMKSALSETKLKVQSTNHFINGPSDILRQGIVGGWKSSFTVSQNEAFNKLFEKKMAGTEIGDLVREYIM